MPCKTPKSRPEFDRSCGSASRKADPTSEIYFARISPKKRQQGEEAPHADTYISQAAEQMIIFSVREIRSEPAVSMIFGMRQPLLRSYDCASFRNDSCSMKGDGAESAKFLCGGKDDFAEPTRA